MDKIQKRKNNLDKERKQWQIEKQLLQEEVVLKQDKINFFKNNKLIKKSKISATKKIVLFLFINCSIIEIFTGLITLINLNLNLTTGTPIDFTPIVTLIGAVVSEVIGFAIYAAKATKENTQGGVVYETAMHEFSSLTDNYNNHEGEI